MSFPRYKSYKKSGIEWVGEVPSHWQCKPLLSAVVENDRPNFGMVESNLLSLSYGAIVKKDINENDGLLPESFETYQIVEPCDIVWRLTDLQNDKRSLRTAIVREKGIITSAYLATKPINIEPNYLNYLLRAYDLTKVFYSMGGGLRQSMKFSDVKRMPIPLPTEAEQTDIAAFLDRETSKIDALVEEQKRLIELLKEKRQAVISRAVTKGLNPDAPMKDSGVEWLGEVPAHWALASVRHLLSGIEQGWSPECESRPAAEEEWGVLKAGCVNGGIYREHENKALPSQLEPMPEYEVQPGDVLMSRANGSPQNVGAAAYISSTRPRIMLSDKTFRIRPSAIVFPKYLAILLGSQPLRFQIERSISGADGLANNLPQSSLKAFRCVIPSLAEQQSIVAVIEEGTREIDDAIATCDSSVNLLLERRSALISAAVTGKIDVRKLVGNQAEAA